VNPVTGTDASPFRANLASRAAKIKRQTRV